jgi:hypothetical protein
MNEGRGNELAAWPQNVAQSIECPFQIWHKVEQLPATTTSKLPEG